MTIQINEPGPEAYYRELVSFSAQYRRVLKKPDCRIGDRFLRCLLFAGLGAVVIAVFLLTPPLRQSPAFVAVAVVWGVLILAELLLFFTLRKNLRQMQKAYKPSSLTLDETGVTLQKEDNTVRTGWKDVAFVRVLSNGVFFVMAQPLNYILSVPKPFSTRVLSYLRQYRPDVKVVR